MMASHVEHFQSIVQAAVKLQTVPEDRLQAVITQEDLQELDERFWGMVESLEEEMGW